MSVLPTILVLRVRDHDLEVGPVTQVPAVGEYVSRFESGWFGVVSSRKWSIERDGMHCTCTLVQP